MNITKIDKGFKIDGSNLNYEFNGDIIILSETECHTPTNRGLIFFNLSVSINNQLFETIQEWISNLNN
jgi:hypothetical protein